MFDQFVFDKESWYELNEEVKNLLLQHNLCSSEHNIKIYNQLSTAVYETVFSLAHFYSHKKKIAWFSKNHPFSDLISSYFYKESYDVLDLDYIKNKNDHALLTKDLALVFFAEDHLITAEYFDFKSIEKHCTEQKIFNIKTSFNSFLCEPRNFSSYTTEIYVFAPDCVVVCMGAKNKSSSPLGEYQLDVKKSIVEKIKYKLEGKKQDKDLINRFEKNLPSHFSPYFVNNPFEDKNRIYDRTLFFHDKFNGDFILTELKKHPELLNSNISTTNNCFWKNKDVFKWATSALVLNQENSLIVIDLKTIESHEKQLLKLLAEIKG